MLEYLLKRVEEIREHQNQEIDSRSLLGLKVESCPTQQTGDMLVTDQTRQSHASLRRPVPATTIKMAKNDKTGGNTGREKDTKTY